MINKINKLPQSEFVKVFANIFENATWIAEELYKLKPFLDFDELSLKMINIFEKTSKEKKLKILNNHPDLGNKAKITSLTIDSSKEQTNAGLDQCTKEEFDEFNKLNPQGAGDLKNVSLLKAGWHIGINTVGQSLRNPNLQLRIGLKVNYR